jgi:hypothetical protein
MLLARHVRGDMKYYPPYLVKYASMVFNNTGMIILMWLAGICGLFFKI